MRIMPYVNYTNRIGKIVDYLSLVHMAICYKPEAADNPKQRSRLLQGRGGGGKSVRGAGLVPENTMPGTSARVDCEILPGSACIMHHETRCVLSFEMFGSRFSSLASGLDVFNLSTHSLDANGSRLEPHRFVRSRGQCC